MGYYASGSGYITLRENYDESVIDKAIIKAKDNFEYFDYGINNNIIDFSITDYHWHDTEMDEFLVILYDYIVDGNIEMKGEEENHWKLKWNKEEEWWDTFDGDVIFKDDLSRLSNDVLIAELKSRGYEVVKQEEE